MNEELPYRPPTDRQEYGHEIFLADIKDKIGSGEYKEALRLAKIKHEDLKKVIEAEDDTMTARELSAVTDEHDEVRLLYDPLVRLAKIAEDLESEMGTQPASDLIDEAQLIRQQLVVLIQND